MGVSCLNRYFSLGLETEFIHSLVALQQPHVGTGDSLSRNIPDLVALEERLERLKDSITVDIDKIKEEIAVTITNQEKEI